MGRRAPLPGANSGFFVAGTLSAICYTAHVRCRTLLGAGFRAGLGGFILTWVKRLRCRVATLRVLLPALALPMFIDQSLLSPDLADLPATLQAWRQRWPASGVLALVPEALAARVPDLQQGFVAQSCPLLGAVFPQLLSEHGFVDDRIALLCFERMPASVLQAPLDPAGVQAWHEAVGAMQPVSPGAAPPLLFSIFDAQVTQVGALMDGLYEALTTPLRFAGVNAGSETFQPMPCLFDAQRLVQGGVISWLAPAGVDAIARHGYPVSRGLLTATSGHGNRIDTIDHRPAFEVYQALIRQEFGIDLTRENFYDYAVHFPFGLVTVVDVLVRIPVALNDDGSLLCVGEIPPGNLMRVLRAPAVGQGTALPDLVEFMLVQQHQRPPQPWPTFYCAGRRMHLGEQAEQELQALDALSGQSGLIGALSLGEIDTLQSEGFPAVPRFHNACVLVLG